MQAICKIGAYLKIFHEGTNFNWETSHMKYKDKYESSKFRIISWHFPFILVSLAVSVIFSFKIKWNCILSLYEISKIGVYIIMFSSICYKVIKYRNISPRDYIDRWIEVKEFIEE